MNILGYTVFDEPVRAREKCYPPVWLILITDIARGVVLFLWHNTNGAFPIILCYVILSQSGKS